MFRDGFIAVSIARGAVGMQSTDSPESTTWRPMSIDAALMRHWQSAVDERRPLPSELALATELGVSRPTVREALIRLESAGLVRREAGKGTFPNAIARDFPLRLDQSFEFSDVLSAAGFEATVEVIESGWTTLSAADAAPLHAPLGAPAFRTVKLWRADGRPVMAAEDLVPGTAREGVDLDGRASVFEIVTTLRGTTVEWEGAQVEPVLPDEATARILSIDAAQPVLRLAIIGVSRHGERLYLAREHHDARVLPYGLIRSVL